MGVRNLLSLRGARGGIGAEGHVVKVLAAFARFGWIAGSSPVMTIVPGKEVGQMAVFRHLFSTSRTRVR